MSSNSKECSSNTSNNNNGLNFGQKTYFEDNNNNNNNNNDNNVGGKIGKRNNNAQNGITPRCQVEGCNVDLSDAKSYYSRHKVCGMHSKSPLVIVNGIQQRFCQQCSRFHQLPEFDQGKRSCRRRLAGHNERRRKPPPGSLLSPRLGHLSSSLFSDGTSRSGFLLDFSLYSRPPGRDLWPGSKTSEAISGSSSLGKFHRNPWPGNQSLLSVNTEDPPKMYQHGSAGETSFTIPSGERVTGISSDSTCALSLLSNRTWCSTYGSSNPDLGSLANLGAAPISRPTSTSATLAHLPNNNNNPSWNFKSNQNEADNIGLQGGLGQFSHASNTPLQSDPFMELEHDNSRGYNSAGTSQVHWPL